MDDCDDPDLSPLIMLIKFPNLRILSAINRKETLNLEVDIKLLQEMLRFEQIKPKSLPIEKVNIYHYYMDYETHLDVYQRTWNRISMHSNVALDIKICGYLPQDQDEDELERELSLLEQRIQKLQMQQNNRRPTQTEEVQISRCQRIVSVSAQCWYCGYHFNRCWRCVPVCEGCQLKRMPPMANDNQIRLKNRKKISMAAHQTAIADEDDFSVFG